MGNRALPARAGRLVAMGQHNEALVQASVLLSGEGLQPTKGARMRCSGDRRTVIGGPFPETKELIAGYWLWQVQSKEEAIAAALNFVRLGEWLAGTPRAKTRCSPFAALKAA